MSRSRVSFYLLVAATFTLLFLIAWTLSRYLGIDTGLTLLGCMVICSVVLSLIIQRQRSRLAAQLQDLPAAQRKRLAEIDPEYRYAIPRKTSGLSATAATRIGAVFILGPLLPIFIAPLYVAEYLFGFQIGLASGSALVLFGFLLAWSWWSVTITIWRRWAAQRGVDLDEMQWRGEEANLLHPKGDIFEKTELGQILDRWTKRRRG